MNNQNFPKYYLIFNVTVNKYEKNSPMPVFLHQAKLTKNVAKFVIVKKLNRMSELFQLILKEIKLVDRISFRSGDTN